MSIGLSIKRFQVQCLAGAIVAQGIPLILFHAVYPAIAGNTPVCPVNLCGSYSKLCHSEKSLIILHHIKGIHAVYSITHITHMSIVVSEILKVARPEHFDIKLMP